MLASVGTVNILSMIRWLDADAVANVRITTQATDLLLVLSDFIHLPQGPQVWPALRHNRENRIQVYPCLCLRRGSALFQRLQLHIESFGSLVCFPSEVGPDAAQSTLASTYPAASLDGTNNSSAATDDL